jgi:hypothetical protein
MIIVNLATYPPRESSLRKIIDQLSPQVDRINIILNEYTGRPRWDVPQNAHLIMPPTDLKDCGKFYPDVLPDDIVFLADDDICYPPDYVGRTVDWLRGMPDRKHVVGYHGTTYRPPLANRRQTLRRLLERILPYNPIRNRETHHFARALDTPTLVDQLGTGVAATWGENIPPFGYMMDSQKFTDIRFAKWCFSKRLTMICLPREAGWLTDIHFEASIYRTFTVHSPPHIRREIMSYALRRRD